MAFTMQLDPYNAGSLQNENSVVIIGCQHFKGKFLLVEQINHCIMYIHKSRILGYFKLSPLLRC